MKTIFYTFLLIGSQLLAIESNYDSSTVGSAFVSTPKVTTAKELLLPAVSSESLNEALVDFKSYAEAIGRKFTYHVKAEKKLLSRHFSFSGGGVNTLVHRLNDYGFYANYSSRGMLSIISSKTHSFDVSNVYSPSLLSKKVKAVQGVTSVHLRKNRLAVTASYTGNQKASAVIELYTANNKLVTGQKTLASKKGVKELRKKILKEKGVSRFDVKIGQVIIAVYLSTKDAEKTIEKEILHFNRTSSLAEKRSIAVALSHKKTLRDILVAMHPYTEISPFQGEGIILDLSKGVITTDKQLNETLKKQGKYISAYPYRNASGHHAISYTVGKYEPISLDIPYTVKTLVKKLGEYEGVSYDVSFDANIPVNRNVKIRRLEDLNKYLKATHGQSFRKKKISKDTYKILPNRGSK